MAQKEDESLEDLIEIFMYNFKREKLHNSGSNILKTLLLKSTGDEWINILNIMSKGDVSQLTFEEICELCKHISRGKVKYGNSHKDPVMAKVSKLASDSVSQLNLAIC